MSTRKGTLVSVLFKRYLLILFPSAEELIDAIQNDIHQAKEELDKPHSKSYLTHTFFTDNHINMNDVQTSSI